MISLMSGPGPSVFVNVIVNGAPTQTAAFNSTGFLCYARAEVPLTTQRKSLNIVQYDTTEAFLSRLDTRTLMMETSLRGSQVR